MEKWLIDSGNAVVEDWAKNEPQEMSQVKHVIEHRVATPRQYHLPPLQNAPQPPPAPQHIIQQLPVPQPVYQNLVPEQKTSMFNKADFMEMMMIQHQQMHQMVMQQMMLSQLPGGGPRGYSYPAAVMAAPVAEPVMMARPGGAVHHHHYSMTPAPVAAAPAQQPVVHHYQSLPPLEGRGPGRMLSPARVRTTPGYYFTNGDSGSNYYVYH